MTRSKKLTGAPGIWSELFFASIKGNNKGDLLNDWSEITWLVGNPPKLPPNSTKLHQTPPNSTKLHQITQLPPNSTKHQAKMSKSLFTLEEDECILGWLADQDNCRTTKYNTAKALTEYLRDQKVSSATRSIESVHARIKVLEARKLRGMQKINPKPTRYNA